MLSSDPLRRQISLFTQDYAKQVPQLRGLIIIDVSNREARKYREMWRSRPYPVEISTLDIKNLQ